MQMCRWFGYRLGYEDLCKVWLSARSYRWYNQITRATNELYEDLEMMSQKDMTPENFGLKVKKHDTTLMITRHEQKDMQKIEK